MEQLWQERAVGLQIAARYPRLRHDKAGNIEKIEEKFNELQTGVIDLAGLSGHAGELGLRGVLQCHPPQELHDFPPTGEKVETLQANRRDIAQGQNRRGLHW